MVQNFGMGAEWAKVLVELGIRWPVSPANVSTQMSTKSFWGSMLSPGSRGCILAESTSFGRFSTGHTAKTTLQLLMEFWNPADWMPYSPHLNLLDFCIWCVLQVKSRWRLMPIWPPMDWDWLVAEYICKTCFNKTWRHLHWKKNPV
jgi:hypothetical protein